METLRDSFFGTDPHTYGGKLGQDAGTAVEFYWNEVAEAHYCRMTFAGDRQKIWDQAVRDQDKRRFPREWDLYQRGMSQDTGQMPLKAWGQVDDGSIEIYGIMHIRTVEQLAAVPDANFSQFPPGHTQLAHRHREMARHWVQERMQSAGFDKAIDAAERASQTAETAVAENAELKAQLAELRAKIEAEPVKASNDKFPKPAGGPYFMLSDGTKVKGRKKAEEAEEALHITSPPEAAE